MPATFWMPNIDTERRIYETTCTVEEVDAKMSPDEINHQHGKASWKCWSCKAESGLSWWNGLSVAICSKPECRKALSQFYADEAAAEEAYQAYVRETYGDSHDT